MCFFLCKPLGLSWRMWLNVYQIWVFLCVSPCFVPLCVFFAMMQLRKQKKLSHIAQVLIVDVLLSCQVEWHWPSPTWNVMTRMALDKKLTDHSLDMWKTRFSIVVWVVLSNIFHFHPYLGKWSNLTNIFQMGWNHQLVVGWCGWMWIPWLMLVSDWCEWYRYIPLLSPLFQIIFGGWLV